jgi:FAD:protein FMN transferase
MTAAPLVERGASLKCFGGECAVWVTSAEERHTSEELVGLAQRRMLEWHARFTRFDAASELTRMNSDPRETVPVSPSMARFVDVALGAARESGGLVDPTLLGELEDAGYDRDLGPSVPLARALEMAPERVCAQASPAARWRSVVVDLGRRRVTRPPGVRLDCGGIVKGLLADMLGEELARADSYAIDCAGDLRVGGRGQRLRGVDVESPLDGGILHRFELSAGGIATSGIGRRSWLGRNGRPAHHLLDPRTGTPAFTGLVQATALAPTAVEAEIRAKAALLSGPERAREWLPDGGVLVDDGGTITIFGQRSTRL